MDLKEIGLVLGIGIGFSFLLAIIVSLPWYRIKDKFWEVFDRLPEPIQYIIGYWVVAIIVVAFFAVWFEK